MANWFPFGKNGNEEGWRLDIVSLLAVIGETSIESHAQTLTSSWTCMLPRLIPAPQVLLKPSRPNRMPQVNATVVGVHNGTKVDSLNYFPNILHPIDDLPPFSFKVLRITHKPREKADEKGAPNDAARRSNDVSASTSTDLGIVEEGPGPRLNRRTTTFREKIAEVKKNVVEKRPRVPPKTFSPLNLLTMFSFILTMGLIATAVVLKDGTAVVALLTSSAVSSIVGYASLWRPELMKREFKTKVPPGDVVIRTREGAFLLVKCDEDVSRELYFGTEVCKYSVKKQPYHVLVGIGTFVLMISVVLLGNCNFNMQAAIASSYIFLNGAFWAISLVDKHKFWDLSAYDIEDITQGDAKEAHENTGSADTELKPSFTRTMWYAIRETQKIGWVKRSGAAPDTTQWDTWLNEAEEAATKPNRNWAAVKRCQDIIGAVESTPQAETSDEADTAAQHVPAQEIAPDATK